MTSFQPSRVFGGAFALGGVPFALTGLVGLAMRVLDPQRVWSEVLFLFGFFLLGLMCTTFGLATLAYRIEIDPHGMSRVSWFGWNTNRDSWTALRSWTTGKIEDIENPERYFVEFNFADRRWPFRIEASFVVNPGFRDFVAAIRAQVPAKEKPAADPRHQV